MKETGKRVNQVHPEVPQTKLEKIKQGANELDRTRVHENSDRQKNGIDV